MHSREQIIRLLESNRDKILSLGVRKLSLFGSYAKGLQNAASDIDLLVEFDPSKKKFDNFMALYDLLEDIFGNKVELITKESLKKFILDQIRKEMIDVHIS
ncbi:MAG: nucleotidyltransferase family protein [Candidatus Kapaibacterium sp.]